MCKETIFFNGKIFTGEEGRGYDTFMHVKDGMILKTGKDLNRYENSCKNTIDMKGRFIMPGFVDSHIHMAILSENFGQIACLPPDIKSIDDILSRIKKCAFNEQKCILGWGYDENMLEEKREPDRFDLDKAAPDIPVILSRSCCHVRSVNSRALELAGITKETPDPDGGKIERDKQGNPTGVLRENARFLVNSIIPPLSQEERIDNLLQMSKTLSRYGVTSICDMGNLNKLDYFPLYKAAEEKGLGQRVALFYMWDQWKNNLDFLKKENFVNNKSRVCVGGIKLIADGGISAKTAWIDTPYEFDERNYGISTCKNEDIEEAIDFCKENKLQLSVHAIGQKAISQAINSILSKGEWDAGERCYARLEHFMMPSPEDIATVRDSNIALAVQPVFLFAEVSGYTKSLGEERFKKLLPLKKIFDENIKVALSSDAPALPLIDAFNPFVNIKTAVVRKTIEDSDCGSENRIAVKDAIKAYTAASEYISGIKGTGLLKKGYFADFIVLSENIFEIKAEDIDKINVLETYSGGEKIFDIHNANL